ncbi:MAG: tRNA (adenosine(37)-N6)-threonylcarbamoyltransferase complex transferase subunit TsaD [Candidatus Vogelbacteria bacterium]|nr:tRNA (adenosine(37)-N6)-threonylcarbamoyltransferase complex transferase subunit TsaD [Candidatus Vogelbacteria bacterium]
MRILSIETSCDETAISILEATGTQKSPAFTILSSVVHTQAPLHAEWQGVVPNLAKREHSRNLVPILIQALREAGLFKIREEKNENNKLRTKISKMLERENELGPLFLESILNIAAPNIDTIAVTYGPGLEPALWTGINFAKALGLLWNKPIIPINHMEGHILSVLVPEGKIGVKTKTKLALPAIALLISGGHTELVLIKDWLKYKVIGHTRDDAVGEAFDKVARILGMPYPGGPHISKLAAEFSGTKKITFPRPMIHSEDLDFSFSGLKTSVLYFVKKLSELTDNLKKEIAHEFEESVVDVLISKTKKALDLNPDVKTLIIGGGVIANKKIRAAMHEIIATNFRKTKLLVPHSELATDNATMIAIAGYFRFLDQKSKNKKPSKNFKASGNLVLK